MNKIIWTEYALNCIERVASFIALDSEYYSREFVRKIIEQIEALKAFSKMGRVVPEFNDGNLRELIYQNYRIVYLIKDDSINLIYIGHASKLLPNLTIH